MCHKTQAEVDALSEVICHSRGNKEVSNIQMLYFCFQGYCWWPEGKKGARLSHAEITEKDPSLSFVVLTRGALHGAEAQLMPWN